MLKNEKLRNNFFLQKNISDKNCIENIKDLQKLIGRKI